MKLKLYKLFTLRLRMKYPIYEIKEININFCDTVKYIGVFRDGILLHTDCILREKIDEEIAFEDFCSVK